MTKRSTFFVVVRRSGPEWDPALKRFYTSVTDKDVFVRNSYLSALFSDSFRMSAL